jgi:hypothetical protein
MSTVSYQGPRVSRLRLSMPAITAPGFFQLLFNGSPANSESLRFSLKNTSGLRRRHKSESCRTFKEMNFLLAH